MALIRRSCNALKMYGVGWSGKFTIMDVTTKEYWQSDLTPDLYGGTPGRLAVIRNTF